MSKIGNSLTKRKMLLGLATVLVAAGVISSIVLVPVHNKQQQEAERQAELQTYVAASEATYAKPVSAVQQYSQLPAEKRANYIQSAARYYGVSGGDTEPVAPLEVVGACIREKNIELAQSYAGQTAEAIDANSDDITHVRQLIGKYCYERYSADRKVPEAFSRDKHNH